MTKARDFVNGKDVSDVKFNEDKAVDNKVETFVKPEVKVEEKPVERPVAREKTKEEAEAEAPKLPEAAKLHTSEPEAIFQPTAGVNATCDSVSDQEKNSENFYKQPTDPK